MVADYSMNDLMRLGGRGSKTGQMPDDYAPPSDDGLSGSRDFTVQPPGTHSPDDQFTYEPLMQTPGAWAVYPPGVPCDPATARISRSTPADVPDFPKMQAALDEESAPGDATSAEEPAEGEPLDTGTEGMGGSGA
jgi:hypothetical protein